MNVSTQLVEYENSKLNPETNPTVRELLDIKASINPTYLDWLAVYQDGTIDLTKTVLRLAQVWSQLSCTEKQRFGYGPDVFKASNIQATFFQYELEIDAMAIQQALQVQVKAGLLKRLGRSYVATNPVCK